MSDDKTPTANKALEAIVYGTFEGAYHAPADPEDLQRAIASQVTVLTQHVRIDTATALWMLDSYAKNLKTAAGAVQAAIDQLRIDDIRKNGAVRLGDQAFTIGPDNTRKLLVPIDHFLGFVASRGWPLEEVFSLSERNVRITAFRALVARDARAAADLATEEEIERHVQTVEDTLFEKVEKESADGRWVLKALPLKQAKWAETLGHGQRRPPKTPKGS